MRQQPLAYRVCGLREDHIELDWDECRCRAGFQLGEILACW